MNRGRLIAYDDRRLRFLLDWIVPLLPRRKALSLIRNVFDNGKNGQRSFTLMRWQPDPIPRF